MISRLRPDMSNRGLEEEVLIDRARMYEWQYSSYVAHAEALNMGDAGTSLWHFTLTMALALAFGSTLTGTMRLPCFEAAVTTTSSRAPGSSGLFWPPQAFTQFVRSRNADIPCTAVRLSNEYQAGLRLTIMACGDYDSQQGATPVQPICLPQTFTNFVCSRNADIPCICERRYT